MRPIQLLLVGWLLGWMIVGGVSIGAAAPPTTRTDSAGGVTVTVTPLASTTNGDARFHVALNTHSVDLNSYDLKNLIVLRDGAANIYHPTSVETKGGGHHRQATVAFAKLKNSIKHIELVVKGIAGVHERVFQWDLK